MSRTTEAFSRVKIDDLLKDAGWNRPDRWTLETLGATEMLAHLERQGLLASAPANSRKPSPRTTKSLVSGPPAGAVRARRGSTAKPLA